jgi:uncharacterized protein YgiM (DUF1202 family)
MFVKSRKAWSFIILLSMVFLTVHIIKAQDETPILINVDENLTGELSEEQPSASYLLGITQPQLISIQVLGITTDFAPTFSIFDPSGLNIFSANNQNLTIASTSQAFINPGAYRIVVSSGNGAFGQYLISLQGGGELAAPQAINVGDVLEGSVSAEAQLVMYSFSASESDNLRLTVRSNLSNGGPSVMLQDAATGETLGLSNGRLIGAQFYIPASLVAVEYRVQVNYNANAGAEQSFVLCLEGESAEPNCPVDSGSVVLTPPSIPSETPRPATLVPLSSTGPCVLAPSGSTNVNVRSQPNTNASVMGQLNPNTTLPVTGKLGDSSWYQVNFNGTTGWVSASVARLGGECGSVTIVNPSATSAASPTTNLTASPTASATTLATATYTATASATLTPAAVATLNYSLPAVYGSTSLTSGFVPDPYTVGITSGGPANVSYLGTGCTGFASSAPSFSINYTSGGATLLRFYFVGSGDTTMIVNSPSGSYFCTDDSFGTLNPSMDFNSPSSGRYDVWIGSFAPGASIGGTLYVTELSGNHP